MTDADDHERYKAWVRLLIEKSQAETGFCPGCGRKRVLVLRRSGYDVTTGEPLSDMYIQCTVRRTIFTSLFGNHPTNMGYIPDYKAWLTSKAFHGGTPPVRTMWYRDA